MIDKVLKYLRDDIQTYLELQNLVPEIKTDKTNFVMLSSIVKQNGDFINVEDNKKVIIKLINASPDETRGGLGGATQNGDVPTNVTLYILLAVYVKPDAGGEPYEVSLRILSKLIEYFQLNKVLKIPDLPVAAGEQIHTKLVKLSFDEQSNVWSMIGAKHMPSVVYELRSVSIKGNKTIVDAPPITQIEVGEVRVREDHHR